MKKPQKPHLFFIYLTIFVNIVGFGMVFPLLPFYAREFQASESLIGLLAASFAIGEFFSAPIWGRISDRWGRKPVILASLLGISFAFLSFAIANSLTWLFISRFLQGLFSAGIFTSASAYVADITTKDERIRGMSRLGASLALGFIFGPSIGGILSSLNHQLPFFTASAVAVANLIFVQLTLRESLKEKEEKLILREGFLNIGAMYHGLRGQLGALFILLFLWSYALSNNQVAIPLFGAEVLLISSLLVGVFFSLQGLVSGTVQWFLLERVAPVFGEHKIIILGLSIMAGSLFFLPFSPIPYFMGILMMSFSFGSAIARPTIQTLISKKTHEGQGTTMGVAAAFESSGRILGPLLGGWVFSTFGFHAPFNLSALVIILAVLFVIQIKGFLKD